MKQSRYTYAGAAASTLLLTCSTLFGLLYPKNSNNTSGMSGSSGSATSGGVRSKPFYYTIQSNASLNIYPDNKPNNFKVNLATPLQITGGNWVVGIAEIHYPCDFTPHIDPQKSSKPPGSEKLLDVEDANGNG